MHTDELFICVVMVSRSRPKRCFTPKLNPLSCFLCFNLEDPLPPSFPHAHTLTHIRSRAHFDPRGTRPGAKRLWAVVFAGEGADDVGGPYRPPRSSPIVGVRSRSMEFGFFPAIFPERAGWVQNQGFEPPRSMKSSPKRFKALNTALNTGRSQCQAIFRAPVCRLDPPPSREGLSGRLGSTHPFSQISLCH